MKKLLTAVWCMISLGAFGQPYPANFNLVPNGSFELVPRSYFRAYSGGTLYASTDTAFANNPFCWIRANRAAVVYQSGIGSTEGPSTHHAHSGQYCLRIDACQGADFKYKVSTGQIFDTATNIGTRIGGRYDLRTYKETKLYEPLVQGRTYALTIYVGYFKNTTSPFSDPYFHGDAWILGNLGVHFSQAKVADYSILNGALRLNVIPQIRFTSWPVPVNDTFSYTKLTAIYTAQGGEQYMTIGNFDFYSQFHFNYINPSVPQRDTLDGNSGPDLTYIDDISLVADTTQPMISLGEFSLGPDTTVCTGATIGGNPGFFHYWWSTGDTTRLIHVTTPGAYWCTVDYGCSTFTDTINVAIRPLPAPFHLADSALCAGKPYTGHAPRGYAGYAWSNGSGADSAVFYAPGRHWARITDVCGVSYTDSFRIVNTAATTPGININTYPPIVLCQGAPTRLVTNTTGAGPAPAYQWYKNGLLLPAATAPTYLDSALANGDTLTVALYSSASCPVTQPTISNHVGVTVYPVLATAVSIAASPDSVGGGGPVTFTATPVNGGTAPAYTWYLNEVPQPYDTGDTWTATGLRDGDVVKVRMQSAAPCPAPASAYSARMVLHDHPLGVVVINGSPSQVQIYPNPVRDRVFIEWSTAPVNGYVMLYDAYGNAVLRMPLTGKKTVLNVATLPAGLYLYQIMTDGQQAGGKLVKF